MYKIVYEKRAVEDIGYLKRAGLDGKARELIEIIRQNPFQKPPEYVPLVGILDGFYSRRINIRQWVVYQVYEGRFTENEEGYDGVVKIVCMWMRYDETD